MPRESAPTGRPDRTDVRCRGHGGQTLSRSQRSNTHDGKSDHTTETGATPSVAARDKVKPQFLEFPTSAGTLVIGDIPAGFRGIRHEHEGRHHMCVVSGTLVDHAGRAAETFSSGMCRVSPSDEVHRIAAVSRTRVVLLHSVPPSAREVSAKGDGRRVESVASLRAFDLMTDLLAFGEGREQATLDEVAILLANVGARVGDHVTRPVPRWLRSIAARMQEDFHLPLTIEQLCDDAGISRFHATRTFSAVYGCSMSAYLQRRRVEYVRRRLHDDTPLSVIAAEAGFADQSHMTRIYRRVHGGTPGVERARRLGVRGRAYPR